MVTQIIRIEHPYDGYGLFRSSGYDQHVFENIIDSDSRLEELQDRHYNFPTASRELGYTMSDNQYCAFKSIDSIQKWIKPNEFKVIFELGFNVLLLEVSQCIELEYQVVYEKQYVTSKKIINELFV